MVSEPLTAIASTPFAIAFSISPMTSSVDPCARARRDTSTSRRAHFRPPPRRPPSARRRTRCRATAMITATRTGSARRRRPRPGPHASSPPHARRRAPPGGHHAPPIDLILITSSSSAAEARRRRSSTRAPRGFPDVGAASPTVRPWRSTTARSATCATCSRLCEIRITATPLLGQPGDELEHLGATRAAERGGRLVEDHQPLREGDRAQNRDRLALPARQHADLLPRSTRSTSQPLELLIASRAPSRARAAAPRRPSQRGRRSSRPMRKLATADEIVEQRRGPGAASRCRGAGGARRAKLDAAGRPRGSPLRRARAPRRSP